MKFTEFKCLYLLSHFYFGLSIFLFVTMSMLERIVPFECGN